MPRLPCAHARRRSINAPAALREPRHGEVLWALYCSHFLSAWGDRMWQFAVPVLFMDIFLDTHARLGGRLTHSCRCTRLPC